MKTVATPVDVRDKDVEQAIAAAAEELFADAPARLGQTGFAGLGVDESLGGSGGTMVYVGLVAEAAGRHAAAVGYLGQVMSAHAAAVRGDADLVARVVTGEVRGVVCFEDGDEALAAPAAGDGGDLVVHVIWRGRFPVLVKHPSLAVDDTTWLDPGWRDVRPTGTVPHSDGPEWAAALPSAHGLSAAAMVGLGEGLLDATVAYAKQRRQFDAPIGSFQAIKHALADVHIGLIHTRALVFGALAAFDAGRPEAERLLALAKVAADGNAVGLSRCLQASGGIGFTWESSVHRYLKQALRLRHWPRPHERLRSSVRPR